MFFLKNSLLCENKFYISLTYTRFSVNSHIFSFSLSGFRLFNLNFDWLHTISEMHWLIWAKFSWVNSYLNYIFFLLITASGFLEVPQVSVEELPGCVACLLMHCGGNVEPWKRTHVHQPRDFISHWKSTANAARGGGQSLVRCVRMWNAKCERAAASKSCAALRCAALPCVAPRCNLLCAAATTTTTTTSKPTSRRVACWSARPTPTGELQKTASGNDSAQLPSLCWSAKEWERWRERERESAKAGLWESGLAWVCLCVWSGVCCLILFSLSIAIHACKYAIHTHTYSHEFIYIKEGSTYVLEG